MALVPAGPRLRTPEVAPASLAAGETELGRNAVVWQPILAAGGLSSPPGGRERPPAGKIACHTKHAYLSCWAHLNFHDIRSSETLLDPLEEASRRAEMSLGAAD